MIASVESQRPPRVLVVDNDLDTLFSTATFLRLTGHKVETASTGPEALATLITFQPDIALLDLAMPGMDGYETAEQIEHLALPRPPVLVAVSGYEDVRSKRRSAEAGFDLQLLKPVEPSVLEELHVLVDRLHLLVDRATKTQQQTRDATLSLAHSYIATGYSLLQVARTTEIAATKERCLAKARRISDRLFYWLERFPHLQGIRDDLDDLTRHLPR